MHLSHDAALTYIVSQDATVSLRVLLYNAVGVCIIP